jgi:hypothetical protein
MKLQYYSISILLFISVLYSCSSTKNISSVTYIKHGSSFGMCRGYCFKESTYTPQEKIMFSKAYGRTDPAEFPDKSDTLILVVDSFFLLDKTIGCPDCADRGAEWVEIMSNNKVHKVVFDFGKEPSGMNDLLKLLREEK